MKVFLTYEAATGRIVSRKRVARGQPLPPQGPCDIPGMEGLAVLHCDCVLDSDRVEHGRVVPKGMQEKRRLDRHLTWMKFRQERYRRLTQTDHLLAPDYPLSQADSRALKAKRKASRDIPQKTTDPELAMQMLKTIWEDGT